MNQGLPLAQAGALFGDDRAVARLGMWLYARFPKLDGRIVVDRALGGMSNPTFLLSSDDGWSAVLRKQPSGALARSAHAIDREYRVLEALHGTDVPVPAPILYHAECDILDTPFYLMERLDGRILDGYAMPGLSPAERRAAYGDMARVMAAMHALNPAAIGLGDYGRAGNFFARQFSRWAGQWPAIRDPGIPEIDALIAWLEPRVPQDETLALVHGDFRIANLMFHATEPRIIGVLDWELSTLGHPMVDVGFNTQAWLLSPDENGGLRGLDLAALGIPSEDDYLARYYALRGGEARMSREHRVFAMFRAAVGAASIAARGRSGTSVSDGAAETGARLARAYARRGLELTDTAA